MDKLTISVAGTSGVDQIAFLDVVCAHHSVGDSGTIELLQLLYGSVGNARREQYRAEIVDDIARVIFRRPRLSVDFHHGPDVIIQTHVMSRSTGEN